MGRSRASAKAAGSTFERSIADGLKDKLDNRSIDRKVKTGAKDGGDIANVYMSDLLGGHRIAIECKEYAGKFEIGTWVREACEERVNYGAEVGMAIFKRRGVADPMKQYAVMEVADVIGLITGKRPT